VTIDGSDRDARFLRVLQDITERLFVSTSDTDDGLSARESARESQ